MFIMLCMQLIHREKQIVSSKHVQNLLEINIREKLLRRGEGESC